MYEVDAILKHRTVPAKSGGGNTYEYLVKWVGHTETSWEPEANISHIQALVEYKNELPPPSKAPARKSEPSRAEKRCSTLTTKTEVRAVGLARPRAPPVPRGPT